MFRISRIQELFAQLPRGGVQRLVAQTGSDKHCKGFSSWDHLVAMVYAQLSQARSLRQVEAGFNAQDTHHFHLGTQAVRRSTLADANAKRTPQVFEEVARSLMSRAERQLRSSCRELLYLLDSTAITLKGLGFDDWTQAHSTRHVQGVKLHMLYSAQTQAPCWQSITMGNASDVSQGRTVPLQPGAVYVFDKGYYDYDWWARIDRAGAVFVTRYKYNAVLRLQQQLPVPPEAAEVVLADELVCFANKTPRGGKRNSYDKALRRVTVARQGKRALVLATNDLDSPASLIAQRYKERWEVELFFKWIKQHLDIKRFYGRSENAVRVQILTALITYLLLRLYHAAHGAKESLWTFLGELRATLFQRPSVEAEAYRRRRQRQRAWDALQPELPL